MSLKAAWDGLWNKTPVTPVAASLEDTEIPRYPPFLKGIPITPTAEMLASQQQLIADISQALGCRHEIFDEMVRPLIVRYAEYVHLLPASEHHHHRGAGGLFRHGLEVAFHAARASRDKMFAMERPFKDRNEIAMRWRIAATLAGLCHDGGKPAYDMTVIDREGTHTWEPGKETIVQWATAHRIDRYFIRWRPDRHGKHERFGVAIFTALIASPDVMGKFMLPDPAIMDALLDALSGGQDKSILAGLVAIGEERSVGQDLRENNYPDIVSLAVPVERYLLDAMRQLVRSTRWQVNTHGNRLWVLPDGLYIVWPEGCEDVIDVIKHDKIQGVPRDPDSVADILLERGLAVPSEDAGKRSRYWRKAPVTLVRDKGKPVYLTLLRLTDVGTLLQFPPSPVELVPEPAAVRTSAASGGTPGPAVTATAVVTASVSRPPDSHPEPTAGRPGATPAIPSPDHPITPPPPTPTKNPRAGRGPSVEHPAAAEAPIVPPLQPPTVTAVAATPAPVRAPADDLGRQIAANWMRRHNAGGGGQALLDLIAWWGTRPDLDALARLDGDRLRLVYPAGLGEHDPAGVLNQLDRADLLDTGAQRPRVIVQGERAYTWLSPAATTQALILMGEGRFPRVTEAPAAPTRTTQIDPPPEFAVTEAGPQPDAGKPARTNDLAQTFVALVRAGRLPAQTEDACGRRLVGIAEANAWVAGRQGRLTGFLKAIQNHPACQIDAKGIWVLPAGGEGG